MKALFVMGSRNPNGQTARAAAAVKEGMESVGVQAECVCLPEQQVERCRQCEDDGWGICRSEGKCVIEDDFSRLVDEIAAADTAVFATPVYFSDLSESLRAFLDRLRRTCMHEAGKTRVEGKPALGICVAGGGGGGAPACAQSLDKILNGCGFDLVDVIPVRRQNLEMKLDILRATGTWPVFSGV